MKTMRIFKTTENGIETLGDFTHTDYKVFYSHVEMFMENISDVFPHFKLLRGVWSLHLWDDSKHKVVLSYTAEIINNE